MEHKVILSSPIYQVLFWTYLGKISNMYDVILLIRGRFLNFRKSQILNGANRDKMGRTYKRLPHAKICEEYDRDDINKAVQAIHKGMSLRKAAEKFNIPKSVLGRHKNSNLKQKGCQTVLSAATEELLVNRLLRPKIDDIMFYTNGQIKQKIESPKPLKRGSFEIPELKDHWG